MITLPIKHHGHMIEALYEDEEYQSITDDKLKQDVLHIAFAVRDADKIANWQIVTNEFDFVKKVWLPFPEDDSEKQGMLPPESWVYFSKQEVIPHGVVKTQTNAGELLSTLCWLFDMNYRYSVYYCNRLNLFTRFFWLLEQIKVIPEEINNIRAVVKTFCKQKFDIEI